MSYNFSDGHLGFMQIRKVPQSCHSGKRWIWILEALSNTNPSKKLTVPTISGFTMGHPQLATRLSVVQLEANRQADVLVDTLHCKTEQRRASVLCQLGVQLAARRPIDIVSNLFDPPIYLSKPSAVATSPFSELFCQQGYYFGK